MCPPLKANFFNSARSPWIQLLNSACALWRLNISHDSFLGMGAFGRVFKVSSRGQEGGRAKFMALKLVLPENSMELFKEKQCLEKAASYLTCTDAVVHVQKFYIFNDCGAALLLEHVGVKVPKNQWRWVFVTLGSLHELNIVHGDSRISNCIFVDGLVRWIDFRKSAVFTTETTLCQKQQDMKLLLRSCLYEDGRPESTYDQLWVNQYTGTKQSAETTFELLFAQLARDP